MRNSMEKLQLNDLCFYQKVRCFRIWFPLFLGMLHMEIIQERLEREFNMTVITTVPTFPILLTPKKILKLH
jgi:GTP-binding protein LepA